MIACLVITDGRDECLGRTVAALEANVDQTLIAERVVIDDTGSTGHRDYLAGLFPAYTVLTARRRLGFGGAIGYAWTWLATYSTAEWVLHQEDDLPIQRSWDVAAAVGLLEGRPYLAQVALTRQPWNEVERAAGGVVQASPDDFTDCNDGDRHWLEHRRFFTTNVSVYRRALCAGGWPAGRSSEGNYTHQLLREGLPWGIPGDEVRFAYWGSRDDPPWTEHIGEIRVGHGY